MNERNCSHCGIAIETGRSDKKFCGTSCRTAASRHTAIECQVEGCGKAARNQAADLCPMHYHRTYRGGTLSPRYTPKGYSTTSSGYRMVSLPGHPLAHARSGKWTYEHRVVLYNHIGPSPTACHWCGCMVTWDEQWPLSRDALVVDHLNMVKDDNSVDNLVPSCGPCNWGRQGIETRSGVAA